MARPAAARRWRRHRGTAAAVLVVLTALAVVAVGLDRPATSTPLDPDNPGSEGTAALMEVLDENGVATEVARGAASFEAQRVDAGTTVVVSSVDDLGPSTADRLRSHLGAARLVLLEPGQVGWELFGSGSISTVAASGGLRARCSPGVRDLLPVDVDDLVVEVDVATSYPGEGCFADEADRSVLLVGTDRIVLGAAGALTNDQVLRADNAALGLRLLGGTDRVVWYVPDLADLGADDAVGLGSLLPHWLMPGLVLGGVAMLAVVLWRGRRLGPLAVEALPVVVRSVETTHSRGRLYRSAGDRAHAAGILRTAARTRLAERLGIARVSDHDEDVVRAAAASSGRQRDEVAALLAPNASDPPSDHDLITLAQALDRLDREVRHP